MVTCLGATTTTGTTRARPATLPKHRVGLLVFDKWSYPPGDGSETPSTTTGDKPDEPPPDKPLVTAVWYPASRTRKRPFHQYAKGITGLAVRGALLLPGDKNRPLIVFSHDYGGSGISAVYLMEYLAGCGYVVAAVDHNDPVSMLRILPAAEDETGKTPPGQTEPKTILRHRSYIVRRAAGLNREAYAYRRVEIKTVIDKLIAESKNPESFLAGMIDPERIGLLAHGLGGFTAMSMMGMSRHTPAGPARPADGTGEPARPADGTDKRIKAAVLYSPTVSMWQSEEFYDLATPVMVMYGEKEAQLRKQLPARAAVAYENLLGPKWSVEIRRAHAMTVCNTATIRAAAMPSQTRAVYAQHRMIGQYATVMFDLHVRGRKSAATELTEAQAKRDTAWIKALKVETVRQSRPKPVADPAAK